MRYKVIEYIQFIGCNNNDIIKKEYDMDNSQIQSLRKKLESEEFEECNEGQSYAKMDGSFIFRDDKVRAEVDKAISVITNNLYFDQNTKEWEDVRAAMVKAITESSAENFKKGGSTLMYDFEGSITQISINDFSEASIHYIWDYDYGYSMYSIDGKYYWDIWITEKQKREILKLKPEMLYEHLKKQIGVQTSDRKKNYFAPKFYVGPFALSLQVNYYLWKYREDKGINHELPMTEEEFYSICANKHSTIDVMVYRVDSDGKLYDIGRAGQISCARLCEYLKEVVMNEETEAWI